MPGDLPSFFGKLHPKYNTPKSRLTSKPEVISRRADLRRYFRLADHSTEAGMATLPWLL
jgi:hypothetical protein